MLTSGLWKVLGDRTGVFWITFLVLTTIIPVHQTTKATKRGLKT